MPRLDVSDLGLRRQSEGSKTLRPGPTRILRTVPTREGGKKTRFARATITMSFVRQTFSEQQRKPNSCFATEDARRHMSHDLEGNSHLTAQRSQSAIQEQHPLLGAELAQAMVRTKENDLLAAQGEWGQRWRC